MHVIVVGVDGSPTSRAALRWAADEAERSGAALRVVRAWEYPPALREWDAVPSNYGYLPMAPGIERVCHTARDNLAATVAEVLGPHPRIPVEKRVVEGPPAQVLLVRRPSTEGQVSADRRPLRHCRARGGRRKARDVMTSPVIVLRPDTPATEASPPRVTPLDQAGRPGCVPVQPRPRRRRLAGARARRA
jgi:hypothetical protein